MFRLAKSIVKSWERHLFCFKSGDRKPYQQNISLQCSFNDMVRCLCVCREGLKHWHKTFPLPPDRVKVQNVSCDMLRQKASSSIPDLCWQSMTFCPIIHICAVLSTYAALAYLWESQMTGLPSKKMCSCTAHLISYALSWSWIITLDKADICNKDNDMDCTNCRRETQLEI